MKENHQISYYQSKNMQTETYNDGDTFVTKHYYNAKDAYVENLSYVKDGLKEVKHYTAKGVLSKIEHFAEDKREGIETKYFISKADGSIKSSKTYSLGKLHGENITYNEKAEIIKHEVFALGKLVLKYLREDEYTNDITNVEIINKEALDNLPKIEQEKLKELNLI